jgi:hypothetical protein
MTGGPQRLSSERRSVPTACQWRSLRILSSVTPDSAAYAAYRFGPEVILLAVHWYLRFGLSDRDLEELVAERGIDVDHVSAAVGRNASHHC